MKYIKQNSKFLGLLMVLLLMACTKRTTVQQKLAKAQNTSKWTFVPIPGMFCRDGKGTGVGVKLNEKSDKLLIYLAGGGSCFNTPTCIANLSSFGASTFAGWKNTGLQLGIFDQGAVLNPFRGWNYVYIPYCTGDVHAGTNKQVDIGIYKNQRMTGYNNVSFVLRELQAFYGNALGEVFLTGSSAGGFGTLINAGQFIEAFPAAKTTVLDDSGPILIRENAQPSCLDKQLEHTFEVYKPSDFAQYTSGQYATDMKTIYEYLANKYPNTQFGLVAALEDIVIREFYGYGADSCSDKTVIPAPVSAAVYKSALLHLRDSVLAQYPNWSTCYFDNASHTFSMIPGVFNKRVNTMRYRDWLNSLRDRSAIDVEGQ